MGMCVGVVMRVPMWARMAMRRGRAPLSISQACERLWILSTTNHRARQQQMHTFVPRLIQAQAFPQTIPILLRLLHFRLGRRATILEYLRVDHDLIQKRGIREDRVVHFCELSFIAQLFDESLVLTWECENVFAAAIITS